MSLSPGTRLGAYEVLSPLGAGGMGEVYRARDNRLSREVAIKVLPGEIALDPSRLRRFEKEARAASALNHPNIVTVHEIGREGSVDFLVMELVAGKTLRDLLLSAAIPVRKLLPIAAQIAEGLAAAHEAGIVHRDLKPENVMVTSSGLVKILDFGLAKRTSRGSGSDEGSHLPTETGTSPGMIVGTVGYMSPEQAAGQPIDFRSDQFALGSILYEMATGKRAFQKATAIDTLSAILHEDPPPIDPTGTEAPAPLRWVVERCLSKEPEGRYASSLDLARDLAGIRDRLSEPGSDGTVRSITARPRKNPWLPLGVVLIAAAGLLGGRLLWQQAPVSFPTFQPLTFRRGVVDEARFSPDGQTILYSARWDGEPPHIFLTRPESPTSQRLDLPDSGLASVSLFGELAVISGKAQIGAWWSSPGTLAKVPIAGGAPREVAAEIQSADWAPDGKRMAVVRNGRLEFPAGTPIYEPKNEIVRPRLSPAGDRIAFIDPVDHRVLAVDLHGKEVFVSKDLGSMPSGLAWSPSGQEIWISRRDLFALDLSGKERLLFRGPRGAMLTDVSKEGSALLAAGYERHEVWSKSAKQTRETDLSVLGNSDAMGISRDGKTVLVNENPWRSEKAFYLAHADGSPAQKLGDGYASALSGDGKWAVVARPGPPARLVLVPTGAGEERSLENGGIERHEPWGIYWSLDGRRILFHGREKGHRDRLYIQDVAGGPPRPVTPEGLHTESCSISPDGRFAVVEKDGFFLYPLDGGEPRRVAGMLPTDYVWRTWSEDGRYVYAWDPTKLPFQVFRINLETGQRELWKTILPQDPAGIWNADLILSPDGESYTYNCWRSLQDLFLVKGLR